MDSFNQAPQPKTFAPSREDILQTLAYYFGAPVSPEKLKNYEEHHAMTYHFPDAYYGQNTKLRDTLNNLVLKSPQTWQTSVGLPFVQLTGTVVEWDEVRFDVRLLQRVPYEGVSRMTTSLRRKHRDRVVRRGLGLLIESDFYATEAGRKHFADQLTSIRYCVQETCNFDVLFSYLTCGNYDFRYDLAKSLRPRRNIKMAMQLETSMYAIAQKEGLGLDKAIEDVKYRMSRYGVVPNMLVMPPQLGLYLSLAPEEKTTFKEGGIRAQSEFDSGLAGFASRSFRGLGVVMSEPFEVSDDADSVQMLTRSTQIGEFYVMGPPTIPPEKGAKNFMDLIIYDEESDRHVRIEWDVAVAATCMNEAGGIGNGNKFKLANADGSAAEWSDEWLANASTWAKMNRDGYEVEGEAKASAVEEEEAGSDESGSGRPRPRSFAASSDNLFKAGRVYIVLCRPFIEHLMHSAIVGVAGRDTGATLFGPADMQISANTQVKTIEGHYTGHFKSVVTKPQNVYVMRDIACAGYVAGGNTQFFAGTTKDLKNHLENNLSGDSANGLVASVNKNMSDRLSFSDDVTSKYASMLAFPMSASQYEEGGIENVMSVTTRLLPWEVQANGAGVNNSFPGGNGAFTQYSQQFNLGSIHYGEDMKAAENMEFISQGSTNNALCFLGPSRKYSRLSRTQTELIPGQGHFGPDAIPGDARWRRGESVSLKSAREQMVSLEVAASSMLAFGAAGK